MFIFYLDVCVYMWWIIVLVFKVEIYVFVFRLLYLSVNCRFRFDKEIVYCYGIKCLGYVW